MLALLLLCCSSFAQRISRVQYIEMYKDVAIEQMLLSGVPASITLAQGCLESGDGNSYLATKGNNHFGIKCHNGWSGPTIRHNDDAHSECFRKYSTAAESFQDHSDFLRKGSRYAFLFELERSDYRAWAHGLKKAGYATAPDYAERLIRIIEENDLARYDIVEVPAQQSDLQINGLDYVISEWGDTYGSIAKAHKLFKQEILRFNDLRGNPRLKPGTLVYVRRKKEEAAEGFDTHLFEDGDTMYGISQRYGVQLDCLYKYNNIKKGRRVKAGTVINLRNPMHTDEKENKN